MKVFLTGYMASGKTTTGKLLAEKLSLPFIDLDDILEQQAGMSIAEIFRQKGESWFRQTEAEALRRLANTDNMVVATGGGTPCYHNNMEWMLQNGICIYLRTSPETLYSRLKDSFMHRPVLSGRVDKDLLLYIQESLREREAYYLLCPVCVDTEDTDPSQLSTGLAEIVEKSPKPL